MPNYEAARQAVRKLVKEKQQVDKVEVTLSIADAIAGALDSASGAEGLAGLSGLTGAAALIKSLADMDDGSVLPNINFVYNGLDDADSPLTARYFQGRSLKNVGGAGFNLVGLAASAGTAGVNVASAIQHGNASGSTLVHLLQIGRIAANDKYKQSVTIQDWLKVVLLAKSLKAAVRGASLAGALIPAASLPVGLGTAVAKVGIKLTLTKICYATAAAIHWRAYQEQAISGGLNLGTGGKVGPASQVYWEIFTKRGLTRIFGDYNIAGLVKEPAGWLPLADKLMLV